MDKKNLVTVALFCCNELNSGLSTFLKFRAQEFLSRSGSPRNGAGSQLDTFVLTLLTRCSITTSRIDARNRVLRVGHNFKSWMAKKKPSKQSSVGDNAANPMQKYN